MSHQQTISSEPIYVLLILGTSFKHFAFFIFNEVLSFAVYTSS